MLRQIITLGICVFKVLFKYSKIKLLLTIWVRNQEVFIPVSPRIEKPKLTLCPNKPGAQPRWDPKADPHLTGPTTPSRDKAPWILQMVSRIRRSPNPILNHRYTTFSARQGRGCSQAVSEVIGLNFSPSNTTELGEGEPSPVLL